MQDIYLCDNKTQHYKQKLYDIHSKQMLKMSTVCSDISMEVLMPLFHCVVDGTLV